jgi:hypothetical protein
MELFRNIILVIAVVLLVASCSLHPTCNVQRGSELLPYESRTVQVCSSNFWNNTAIKVKSGREYKYIFSVKNNSLWYDAAIASTAAGYYRSYLVPWIPFRRSASDPWFALICTVDFEDEFRVFDSNTCFGDCTNLPECDSTPKHPEKVCTQAHGNFKRDGTLFCYANDVSMMYGNNSGCIDVTVRQSTEFSP